MKEIRILVDIAEIVNKEIHSDLENIGRKIYKTLMTEIKKYFSEREDIDSAYRSLIEVAKNDAALSLLMGIAFPKDEKEKEKEENEKI